MAENEKELWEDARNEFIGLFNAHISRPGADKLLQYMDSRDFFTAPASTRFHSNYKGGLCIHSLNVFKRLVQNYESEMKAKNIMHQEPATEEKIARLKKTMETLAIVSLLHDLCKIDTYKESCRATKRYSENGSKRDALGRFDWEDELSYQFDEQLFFGHGEKSVYIIMNFMRLTPTEAMAIRFHMGDFDKDKQTSECFNEIPLAALLHIADLEATYLDERVPKKEKVYSFKIVGG